MQIYWRIIEELKFLGENWHFHDPTLKRHYDLWLKKRSGLVEAILSDPAARTTNLVNYGGTISNALN